MKATAVRIGNSSKEQILIDGEVFLKSVDIGRWNYVAKVVAESYTGGTWTTKGKSATLDAAHKWVPSTMFYSRTIPKTTASAEDIAHYRLWNWIFTKAFGKGTKVTPRSKWGAGSYREMRWAIPYTRTVAKVERDYEI